MSKWEREPLFGSIPCGRQTPILERNSITRACVAVTRYHRGFPSALRLNPDWRERRRPVESDHAQHGWGKERVLLGLGVMGWRNLGGLARSSLI